MSVVIRFEDISKQYRLGEIGTGTLSHDLHRAWARLWGKPDPFAQVGELNQREAASAVPSSPSSRSAALVGKSYSSREYVWALRNISFDVRQGEIIGIIGRNGAGKSTLLKLLSRVTSPSTGKIKARGRIASLLEVGTGFHPELTGRENIYLNGAILGMRQREVSRQLDDIVEFSGCAKYLDTPVKRYSSGMTVRLGFAVAAHLQCEILIVDEVLAVGDAEFQRRCIGRMRDVAGEGRTVIFVSHAIPTITSLCGGAVLLERGQLAMIGKTQDVVSHYLGSQSTRGDVDLSTSTDRKGNGRVKVSKVAFFTLCGSPLTSVQCGMPFLFRVFLAVNDSGLRLELAIGIDNEQGVRVSHFNTACASTTAITTSDLDPMTIDIAINQNPLVPGRYLLTTFLLANGEVADWMEHAIELRVEEGDFFGTGKLPPRDQGSVLIQHSVTAGKPNVTV